MGIADSVTVLAETAAMADAAATMIANEVDLPGHPAIRRAPASSVQSDSDLGTRLITIGVGPLSDDETANALDRGLAFAETCRVNGLISAAALCLNSQLRIFGALILPEPHHA